MDAVSVSTADIAAPEVASSVRRILLQCDSEFIPPLSSRNSTTQSELSGCVLEPSGIDEYFDGLKSQDLLVAEVDCEIAGFLSFRNGYQCPELGGFVPANYVTTVCVDPDARGKAICSEMYRFLIESLPREKELPFLAARTWGSNSEHIRILGKFGFSPVSRLKDHRGRGIDTVYFARRLTTGK